MDFISEKNLALHKEQVGRDILRLGILERSVPEIQTAQPRELFRMRVRGIDMRAAAELKASILLHRIFFDSFSDKAFAPSAAIRRRFGSERALCELMLREGLGKRMGFAALLRSDGGISTAVSESALEILSLGEPLLAIDLSEHAYYGDFGFDKEAYLRAALSHLKLGIADGDQGSTKIPRK